MHRLSILFAAVTLLTSACRTASPELKFELRDFKLEQQGETTYTTTHQGHGTLVTLDPYARNHTIVAFLNLKYEEGGAAKESAQWILVKGGIGTVTTFHYAGTANAPAPKITGWEMLGYWPLEEAQLNAQ